MDCIAKFTDICGKQGVLTGDRISRQYTHDWTKSFVGKALAVVLPTDANQVSAILSYCQAQRLPVIVQGGHTGLSGGATPDDSGEQIVLSMERMNKIRQIDETACFMVAEAGCILENLQMESAAHNLFFPLNLAAKGSCHLGGNLATNAGGLNVLRYGTVRDLCLGVEAVLPDGRILNLLTGLRKNNTGYDLKQLIIGSEGSLAVITAASMRLFSPSPPALTVWAVPESVDSALRLLHLLQGKTDQSVSAFELVSQPLFDLLQHYRPQLRLPFSPSPPMAILVEISGMAGDNLEAAGMDGLSEALEAGMISDVVVAQSEAQRVDFWQVRELCPEVNAQHGKWIRTDVALPLSALSSLIDDLQIRLPLVSDGLYIIGFGHLGDGNLHISARPVDANPDDNPELAKKILDVIYERVAVYGGSFSAEHGIGREKVAVLAAYKDAGALAWMRDIKRATDRHNILGPGRILSA